LSEAQKQSEQPQWAASQRTNNQTFALRYNGQRGLAFGFGLAWPTQLVTDPVYATIISLSCSLAFVAAVVAAVTAQAQRQHEVFGSNSFVLHSILGV